MSDPLAHVGFAFNPTSEASLALRDRALVWCAANAVDAWAQAAADGGALAAAMPDAQALIVLGGDGTFLRAVQAVAAAVGEVPILGVNVGKVGFLSQVEADTLEPTLARLRAGSYSLESRMALEATVQRAEGGTAAALGPGATGTRRTTGTPDRMLVALNEAAVVRGAKPIVIRLDVAIGGSHLATYIADGLLVATPTGSTGYSFSAGGPILDPVSRNLVVTTVAAYLAAIRSVVVSPSHTVAIRVVDGGDVLLSIDGHIDVPLGVGDTIEVAARSRPIHFLVPDGALPFWDLLRHKAELLPS
jgi:NAD+ kinase